MEELRKRNCGDDAEAKKRRGWRRREEKKRKRREEERGLEIGYALEIEREGEEGKNKISCPQKLP